MALPTGVNILRISETVKFNAAGQAYRVKNISYMVGQDGPFTLEVEPGQDTTDAIQAQLAATAAKIAALRGPVA